MYPDTVAAQQICAQSPDPQSDMKFRLAIIEGGSISPDWSIAPADCINSRLS